METCTFPGLLAKRSPSLAWGYRLLWPDRPFCRGSRGAFPWAAAPPSRCAGEIAPEPPGPFRSPAKTAYPVLSAEVTVNKQVIVLGKFTVHLGRQSQVLEQRLMQASREQGGTGRSRADLRWGSGKATRRKPYSNQLSTTRRCVVIISQVVEDERNFQARRPEVQRG